MGTAVRLCSLLLPLQPSLLLGDSCSGHPWSRAARPHPATDLGATGASPAAPPHRSGHQEHHSGHITSEKTIALSPTCRVRVCTYVCVYMSMHMRVYVENMHGAALASSPSIVLTPPEALQGASRRTRFCPGRTPPGAAAWWVRGFSVPLAPSCALGWGPVALSCRDFQKRQFP